MEPAGPDRSAMPPHGRHANTTGTDAIAADARIALDGGGGIRAGRHAPKLRSDASENSRVTLTCDKASPERAVMLHLRARYVSKAAILTIPAPLVPVENRSPA